MFLTISGGGVILHEREDLKALKVVAVRGVEVDVELRVSGFGHLDEGGEHAWLEIGALRRRAGEPDGFDAMIAYAERRGWVSDGHVRAHLEWAASGFRALAGEQRERRWRDVLGEYPTGVAIISGLDAAGHPHGLVVGTFSAVSMNPPLASYMPMRSSRAYTAIAATDRFRVSVLGAGHEDLCRAFAAAEPARRFETGAWEYDAYGLPRLTDAVVWFDCVRTRTIEAGDHDIVLGEVEDLGFGAPAPDRGSGRRPLLFLRGGYGAFTVPRLEFDGRDD